MAAPRPAQRARQHRRQDVQPDLPRVRGQHRPAHRAGLRRREVPPRRRGRVHRRLAATQIKVSVAANPSPPRGRRPGARGHRPRQAGRARPAAPTFPVLPAARARRRGVRRPGRGRRDAQPLAAARLPHRRHDPRRRQQPGRLHHLARRRRARRCTAPTWPGWSRRRSST